jgi:hypothetical protein
MMARDIEALRRTRPNRSIPTMLGTYVDFFLVPALYALTSAGRDLRCQW